MQAIGEVRRGWCPRSWDVGGSPVRMHEQSLVDRSAIHGTGQRAVLMVAAGGEVSLTQWPGWNGWHPWRAHRWMDPIRKAIGGCLHTIEV